MKSDINIVSPVSKSMDSCLLQSHFIHKCRDFIWKIQILLFY